MKKASFDRLLALVEADLAPRDGPHPGVETRRRLAATLYWLAKDCMYEMVGDLFGITQSTVHKLLHLTVDVLHRRLGYLVSFPTGRELQRTMRDFEF